MIKTRSGLLALAAAGVVSLSGCASGGGGGGGAAGPGDNEFTRSAELFLTQAATLGMSERYQDALEAAMNSIADDSANARGYFLAGRAHIGLGNFGEADSYFDQALDLYPEYEPDIRIERETAWIDLFNASLEPLDAGDDEEGIRMLEAAEMIYTGRRPEALINLAVTYNNAQRPDEAVDAYGRALDVIRSPAPDSATAANWAEREQSVTIAMATLLSTLERYDEASAAYEAYLETSPTDMTAMSSYAAVLTQSGLADSAQAIYDNLLDAEGLSMRDVMNVGVGLYQAEVFDKAAEAFSRVAEVAPQNRDAIFNWAQALHEAEDYEALVPVAEQLLELDGHNPDSYLLLSRGLLLSDNSARAQEVYDTGEAMSFQLANSQLQSRTGGATITGELVNLALEEGSEVHIVVHFSGIDGAEIGTTEVRLAAPPQDVAQAFRADFSSDEVVMGYYYEVVSP